MKFEKYFDEKLEKCLNDHSGLKDNVGTSIRNTIANAKGCEIIIPVLGMQGMGKSTLINGLLKENILPNDADETTCVPVEVKYGTDNCAKVHFFDSDNIATLHTREELNEYVDNNYNPANEKHVASIELFRQIELLKGGLVIVDLPGVGSLTRENEETTKRYVENLCSAIFVIPTVPTIRNKEALFIKSLWSQFAHAIFVQNDWGESKTEIEESIEFNKKVINRIAKELNNPYDNEIILVNAYNAVYGALHNESKLVASSNIEQLRNKIINLSNGWEKDKESLICSRILMSIDYAISMIKKRMSDLKKSAEELKEEQEKQLKEYKNGTMRIAAKTEEIRRFLRNKEDEVYSLASTKSRECVSKIRAAIYKVIDSGVYDGEHLSKAFEDIQEQETETLFNEVFNVFTEIKFEIEEKFAELQDIQIENDFAMISESFSKESSLKWEEGAQVAFNLGGAAAGILGGGPLLAAIGVAGPPGWVVAGVGIAIYGLFSLCGWGVKQIVGNSRADETKKQIRPQIEKIENSLREVIPSKFEEYKKTCNQILDKILKERDEEQRRLFLQIENSANVKLTDYEEEIKYLQSKRKEFENV